jgi:hypothetical protein
MAATCLGRGVLPVSETMWPYNFTVEAAKVHFPGLIVKPLSLEQLGKVFHLFFQGAAGNQKKKWSSS